MNSASSPRWQFPRNRWIGGCGGVAVILVFAGAHMFQHGRSWTEEITLHDFVAELSRDTMRVYTLRVPRDGTLQIDATSPAGESFSLYVAVARPSVKAPRRNELPLLAQFTSEGTTV